MSDHTKQAAGISFLRHTLRNGLKVLIHKDESTAMAIVNVLYNVGAKHENPDKTGFAHLFEHLMFAGSAHAPDFDTILQQAGGTNNAFTNNDFTNYYDFVPLANLEVALWLEADRMQFLNINEESLEVQRNVVCEEFKEHYINQPYGDVYHLLCDLSYTRHPYRWPTIGKDLSHIENATLKDVSSFYKQFYHPSNAILVVAGNVEESQVIQRIEKWFGDIPAGEPNTCELPEEPPQKEARKRTVIRDVPADGLYITWHMDRRKSREYYAADLITDILASGDDARLIKSLVKEQQLFSNVQVYITGNIDCGLVIFEGLLMPGVKMETAEKALIGELEKLKDKGVDARELDKVRNKALFHLESSGIQLFNRAFSLAYFELLGDAADINSEKDLYRSVSQEDILKTAQNIFTANNSNTLYYLSKNSSNNGKHEQGDTRNQND